MLKRVRNIVYAHCSNFDEWYNHCIQISSKSEVDELYESAYVQYMDMIGDSHYVLKYNEVKNMVSIISSPDWDTRQEPTVGDSICASYDEYGEVKCKLIKSTGQIYHNKWMFVQPSYTGFNITASKLRTVLWNRIPNIKKLKCKISYRNYWNQLLKENGLSL